jgi:two-component system cell cycle sensor histidine kinase/response regulator CckA
MPDVTKNKVSGDALRKRQERCRSMLDCFPDPLVVYDLQGIAIYVNPAFVETFGWSSEEVVGTRINYVPPKEVSRTELALGCLYNGEKVSSFETKRRTKDGAVLDMKINASLVMDECGQPIGNIVSLVDMTEMKHADEVRKLMATAVEQAAEAIVIADKNGNTQYVNPAFERISGYSQEETLGKKISPLESPDYNEAFQRQLWNTLRRGEVWNGRIIGRKKDGTVYFEDTTIAPVRDGNGDAANYVAVKRDVTREVLLEKELLHAQKMEAVGTLAGGIAHDFNNLLTIILGYSEYLLTEEDMSETARGDLNKMSEAARKGAELVQNLLTFSRKVDPTLSPTNLNQQVEEIKGLLGRTMSKNITISVSLEKALATIHADGGQIQQVLMNLAVNAKDAMPDGGRLAIETSNVVLDEEFCRSHLGSKPGNYAMVSVSDTGYGMDKEILNHIFEPFYTTKGLGRGTGLGLAMTYGIVKQHGGYIDCSSAVGQGTTFRVYLPVPEEDSREESVPTAHVLQRGSETVLLVDDEDAIRDLAKKILVRAGYNVLTASNGRDALELYTREAGRISMVILDLVMPEMGGGQCLEELVRIDPNARIIIASGSSPDGPTTEGLEQLAKGFVWKPYNIRQLLQAVRRVLDEG